jgi:hypothetical protein
MSNRYTTAEAALEREQISRAFSRGNFANAYESTDLDYFDLDGTKVVEDPHGVLHERPRYLEHERVAFVLGFFSSYSLDEIGSDREIFDECYFSPAGQYVIKVARYCDDRADEYAAENEDC